MCWCCLCDGFRQFFYPYISVDRDVCSATLWLQQTYIPSFFWNCLQHNLHHFVFFIKMQTEVVIACREDNLSLRKEIIMEHNFDWLHNSAIVMCTTLARWDLQHSYLLCLLLWCCTVNRWRGNGCRRVEILTLAFSYTRTDKPFLQCTPTQRTSQFWRIDGNWKLLPALMGR